MFKQATCNIKNSYQTPKFMKNDLYIVWYYGKIIKKVEVDTAEPEICFTDLGRTKFKLDLAQPKLSLALYNWAVEQQR